MFYDEIFLFIINNNFDYKYIIFFYIISVILLSLPVPYTFIIIANVYVFGWYGFLIVIMSIPLGALITYYYIGKLKNIIKKISFFKSKKINTNFFKNSYLLTLARATLPFFLVSVAMSITKINIKKYLIITILGTFINVLLVSMIVTEIRNSIIKYEDVVLDIKRPELMIPILTIFILIIITNYIKKKFKVK